MPDDEESKQHSRNEQRAHFVVVQSLNSAPPMYNTPTHHAGEVRTSEKDGGTTDNARRRRRIHETSRTGLTRLDENESGVCSAT